VSEQPETLNLKPETKLMNEITIKITDREGTTHEVQAPTDMAMNIMELVRAYELAPEGTIGVCGGMAMCASCQCYVLNDVVLPEMGPDEDAMLAEAFYVKPNSRLGCQLAITNDLEGLEIALAPEY
jgi:2Fe-2S ferredoxin